MVLVQKGSNVKKEKHYECGTLQSVYQVYVVNNFINKLPCITPTLKYKVFYLLALALSIHNTQENFMWSDLPLLVRFAVMANNNIGMVIERRQILQI